MRKKSEMGHVFWHWNRNNHGSRMVTVLQNVSNTQAARPALTAVPNPDKTIIPQHSSPFCSATLKSLQLQILSPSCERRQHYKLCCHLLFWKCTFKALSTMTGNSVVNAFQLMRLDQAFQKSLTFFSYSLQGYLASRFSF